MLISLTFVSFLKEIDETDFESLNNENKNLVKVPIDFYILY